MLHITCRYYNFIFHLNARYIYIHLNTFSTRKSVTKHGTFITLEACTKVSRVELFFTCNFSYQLNNFIVNLTVYWAHFNVFYSHLNAFTVRKSNTNNVHLLWNKLSRDISVFNVNLTVQLTRLDALYTHLNTLIVKKGNTNNVHLLRPVSNVVLLPC